jgi:hypothetical protein
VKLVDNLGQPINVGDIIAYATTIGRSANQSIYEVIDIVEGKMYGSYKVDGESRYGEHIGYKLKAQPLTRSYGSYSYHKPKPSTLSMMERCIVLPKSYKELIEKGNDESK